MSLLVYVNTMNVAGKRLSGVIKAVARERGIEVHKGHLLRPRFLTYAHGNFDDVGVVLGRMLESEPIRTH